MNRLFPLPLYSFLKTVISNGGFSGRGYLHAMPWLLKTTVAEPLRWIELAVTGQKLQKHSIQPPPIFILGYYRSGTTYLQQCFMQDDRLGHLSLFQTVFPELMLCFERIMTPLLEFNARLFRLKNAFHRIPLTWYSPGEEDIAMTGMLSSCSAAWGYLFPEFHQPYFEKFVLFKTDVENEISQWKNDYLLLLKKISVANNGRPLVLKNPPNTARIKMLLSLFPGARFIFIYRNPYDVYASTQRMLQASNKAFALGKTKGVDFNNIILKTFSSLMTRYVEDRKLIPQGQLTELRYEDFITRPVECLRELYSTSGFDDFNYCEKKMKEFTGVQKKYAVLQHQLSAEEIKLITENWEPFIRSWNYTLK